MGHLPTWPQATPCLPRSRLLVRGGAGGRYICAGLTLAELLLGTVPDTPLLRCQRRQPRGSYWIQINPRLAGPEDLTPDPARLGEFQRCLSPSPDERYVEAGELLGASAGPRPTDNFFNLSFGCHRWDVQLDGMVPSIRRPSAEELTAHVLIKGLCHARILRVNNLDGEPIRMGLFFNSLAHLLEDVPPVITTSIRSATIRCRAATRREGGALR